MPQRGTNLTANCVLRATSEQQAIHTHTLTHTQPPPPHTLRHAPCLVLFNASSAASSDKRLGVFQTPLGVRRRLIFGFHHFAQAAEKYATRMLNVFNLIFNYQPLPPATATPFYKGLSALGTVTGKLWREFQAIPHFFTLFSFMSTLFLRYFCYLHSFLWVFCFSLLFRFYFFWCFSSNPFDWWRFPATLRTTCVSIFPPFEFINRNTFLQVLTLTSKFATPINVPICDYEISKNEK